MSSETYTTIDGDARLADFTKPCWTRVGEDTYWDGHNQVSVHSKYDSIDDKYRWDIDKYSHQRMNIKRNNDTILIIIEYWSQWQGRDSYNREVDIDEAKQWLSRNNDSVVDGYPELSIEVD